MLSRTFLDFFFQYYHKAHKNIAYSIENSLRQPAAKFFPQKGANLKSKKAHCAQSIVTIISFSATAALNIFLFYITIFNLKI